MHNYIFFDSHVHIYDNSSIDVLCDFAYQNFIRLSNNYPAKSKSLVLLIADINGSKSFHFLLKLAKNSQKIGDWKFYQTSENLSVLARNSLDNLIIFISGNQIVSSENIEVLTLGPSKKNYNGLPLQDILNNIYNVKSIPILPWGFAKWWGKRGKKIRWILENSDNNFFLGDNGGRTKLLPSSLLHRAKNTSIKILSGSDPLPLPNEIERIGNFGSVLKGEISTNTPCQDIINLLIKDNISVEKFGKLLSPFRFFLNQLYLRLKKFS